MTENENNILLESVEYNEDLYHIYYHPSIQNNQNIQNKLQEQIINQYLIETFNNNIIYNP
ncbi:hypothetical protein Mgra_00004743, partial [Meloidogyne graminicola]